MTKEEALNQLYPNRQFSFTPTEVHAAMESYSTEIQKENERLTNVISKMFADIVDDSRQLSQFQSTIIKKDKESEQLKNAHEYLSHEKGLIDFAFERANNEITLLKSVIIDKNIIIEKLSSSNEAKEKEYWKQRCLASEIRSEKYNIWRNKHGNYPIDKDTIDALEAFEKANENWQQLKQKEGL